jgi:GDP-L-fucose synthase
LRREFSAAKSWDRTDKIFVAGHRGMVGSALVRWLEAEGFSNVVTRDRAKVDPTDQSAFATFAVERVSGEMI